MSGFASHAGPQPSAASGSSAPSSALDIVQAQGVNTWDNLLSPVAETSTTTLPEDSDLMNSPNFLLGVPNYSPELDTTSTPTDPLSWDRLRPTTVSVSDVRTSLQRLCLPRLKHSPLRLRPTPLRSL